MSILSVHNGHAEGDVAPPAFCACTNKKNIVYTYIDKYKSVQFDILSLLINSVFFFDKNAYENVNGTCIWKSFLNILSVCLFVINIRLST